MRISSVGLGFFRDRRDEVLEPHRGLLSSANVDWSSSRLGSQSTFVKLTLKNYTYVGLGRRLVWATGAELGMGFLPGATGQLPLSERYFAGGATTLRGFGFNQAGPRDLVTNRPTGGSSVLVLNQELRYELMRKIIGSVFADIGNVYRRTSDLSLGDLRTSLGVGLRYRGPVVFGIDYARLLSPHSADPRGQLHFSLGYAF